MNNQSRSDAYAAAGVDITAGYRAVELMKKYDEDKARVFVNGVLNAISRDEAVVARKPESK